MASGAQIVENAERKLGQQYVYGARVPLDDPSWTGPWDCAEYSSWAVYQTAQAVYGCTDDNDPPARADAWTGSWKRDVLTLGIRVSIEEAASIKGAMLLRRSGNSGHIVISNGDGETTLEARGRLYGVVRHVIAGRAWDYGVLVPGIEYDRSRAPTDHIQPFVLRNAHGVRLSGLGVRHIQERLSELGFYDLPPTGIFDAATEIAVRDFQISRGLVADGEVASETAQELHVEISPDSIERQRD